MKHRYLKGFVCSALLIAGLSAANNAYAQSANDTTANQQPAASEQTQTPAPSQSDKNTNKGHGFTVGPQVSVYLPSDKTARNRFGDNWLSVGVGIGHVNTPRNGSFDIGLNVIGAQKNKNRVTMVPVTLVYRMVNDSNKRTIPYAKVFGGVYPVEMRSDIDNIQAGWRVGWGGGVSAGVVFDQRAFIDISYNAVTKIRGIDLSGVNLTVGYRF